MEFSVHPLTPALWPALEDLFQDSPVCRRCWCMYWRIGSEYRKRSGDANKAAFRKIVRHGPPPGLLAFHNDLSVGWCQLTARIEVQWLDRNRFLKPVDETPVWSISCFYIRKGFRRQGITETLIREALTVARKAGAPALEAYPLDRRFTPSSSSTGFATTFRKLGFKQVLARDPGRPIMRYSL
jgi:GNAT superfamily N-acetyltransferase